MAAQIPFHQAAYSPISSSYTGSFPGTRLRRLRSASWIRRLVAENRVDISDLVLPIFVREPELPALIPSMPGVRRYTLEELPSLMENVVAHDLCAIALFPVIRSHKKCSQAQEAIRSSTLLLRAITLIKKEAPQVGVITDAALDAYTSHGHDGLMGERGDIDNDGTLSMLAQHALCQAQAGSDVIAPSDMMDGRVGAIRRALDQGGYAHVAILSYTAKYASALYAPFREALQSAGSLGKASKRTYHMDPHNGREALWEAAQDMEEHADMLMVKPGLFYLDILWRISSTFHKPTFGFHVSGEYAMLKAAAEKGWGNYEGLLMESLTSFKRAGACGIFTYGAFDAARLIKENRDEV